MKTSGGVLIGLLALSLSATADKLERTVDGNGVPTISIRGSGSSQPAEARPTVVAPRKEFQVYQLEGASGVTPQAQPAPQIVIVATPPPIAPNPAAYGYGYGYGYGGYGYGYEQPWFGPACPPAGGGFYPALQPLPQPLNYQNPPLNYQNRPLNYQNRVPGQRVWR